MVANQEQTDEELMLAYQAGETTAFNELYQRYSEKVYSYISSRVFNRNERDDLFQAIFLKLHKSRQIYSSQYLFGPWLFTICRTSLLDYLKSKKLETATLLDESELVITNSSEADVSLNFQNAISTLSETQRKALAMRYQEGLGFLEIATRMKASPTNVRQIISRAVRKLRGTYDE